MPILMMIRSWVAEARCATQREDAAEDDMAATSSNISQRYVAPTAEDMEASGFSPAQICRLSELKAVYPYLEFASSADEWHRLTFLKWRHEHGRVPE